MLIEICRPIPNWGQTENDNENTNIMQVLLFTILITTIINCTIHKPSKRRTIPQNLIRVGRFHSSSFDKHILTQ